MITKILNIIGGGGHSLVVIDAIFSNKNLNYIIHLFDDDKNCRVNLSYKDNEKIIYKGVIDDFFNNDNLIIGNDFFVAIGNNKVRMELTNKLNCRGNLISIAHKNSTISENTSISGGVFIGANSVIHPMSRLKKGVIVNTSAVIEHEAIISEFCHVSPGAIVLGGAKVERLSWVGANSIILNNISIKSIIPMKKNEV